MLAPADVAVAVEGDLGKHSFASEPELNGVDDPGVIGLSGIYDAADGVQELAFAAKQRSP